MAQITVHGCWWGAARLWPARTQFLLYILTVTAQIMPSAWMLAGGSWHLWDMRLRNTHIHIRTFVALSIARDKASISGMDFVSRNFFSHFLCSCQLSISLCDLLYASLIIAKIKQQCDFETRRQPAIQHSKALIFCSAVSCPLLPLTLNCLPQIHSTLCYLLTLDTWSVAFVLLAVAFHYLSALCVSLDCIRHEG